MSYQHTIGKTVSVENVGLHTGRLIKLALKPAPANHGVRFVRTDLAGRPSVVAGPESVTGTSFATTISGRDFIVSTVEHLMSALVGLGIDNVIAEVSGEEIPILDGSSRAIVQLIQSAGLVEQPAPRRYLRITRPVALYEEGKSAVLKPHDGFAIDFEIEFDHPVIKKQRMELELTPETYVREIASARTFGFLSEIQTLKANGFAAGGSLDNAIVLGPGHVLNDGGLRYADEFVRHKILDAVGDLFLAGMPILGKLEAKKSGHGLNNRLARKLMNERSSWEIVELAEPPAAAWPYPYGAAASLR
ncbi:UDP-3-O-acyl-N-acetylglucosamine deacetylase [bacterium]|nr:UDP-3-O-acyl-N-acetylglucosamine deacetylase [bacterium]